MQGDPEFRNKEPKNKWKRILLNILEFIENNFSK
jgi:hypothetical protein